MQRDYYIDEKEPRNKANRKVDKNVLISGVSKTKMTLIINQGHLINRFRNHDIT